MASLIPPSPVGVPFGASVWNQWLETVRQVVNNSVAGVSWGAIDFAGSNITSIAARAHNNLQSIQGGSAGQYNHLDNADYAAVSGTRITKGTDTTDDLIVDDTTKGLVLKSPDGHYWRITVDNTGALSTTDLGTSKP